MTDTPVKDDFRRKSNAKRRRIFVNRVAKALEPILSELATREKVRPVPQFQARLIAKALAAEVRARRRDVFAKAKARNVTKEELVGSLYREVAARRPELTDHERISR